MPCSTFSLGYGLIIAFWLINLYYGTVTHQLCLNVLLSGLSYGMVIVSWSISLYYNVVISYALLSFQV